MSKTAPSSNFCLTDPTALGVGACLQFVNTVLCNTTPKCFGLGTISILSSCNTRSRLKCSYLIPTSYTVQILKRICCEKLVWSKSYQGPCRMPWRSSMCTSMKTTSSTIAKSCGAAPHLSELCSLNAFCHEIYPTCSIASRAIQLFSQSPKHRDQILKCGLLFFRPYGLVTSIVNVRCDFLKLKSSKTRPMLGIELGADTTNVVSSPMNSLVTSRVLIPPILWSRSQHVITSFFPRTTCKFTVSYTPHSANGSSYVSLAFVASSVSVLSTRRSYKSPTSSVPSNFLQNLILNSRKRNFNHRHAPNVNLRTFASRMLCLW